MNEALPYEICIQVKGSNANIIHAPVLTSGTVGLPVRFQFDGAWEGLTKVAVFRAGDTSVDRMDIGNQTTVPHEVLQRTHCQLSVGVYGINQEGTVIIPTVYACAGVIQPGADPSGDEGADPSLPVWKCAVMNEPEKAISRRANAVGVGCFAGAKAYQIIAKAADNSVAGADGCYVLAADALPEENLVGLIYSATLTKNYESVGTIIKAGALESGLSGIDADGNHTTGLTGFKIYVSGYKADVLADNTSEDWSEFKNTFRVPTLPLLGNKDYGVAAWAEGWKTQATGPVSRAEGWKNKAVGLAAHAEGGINEAVGEMSHAEGMRNRALGDGSHVEGIYNIAYRELSHVSGVANRSFYPYQTVVGTYNSNKEDTLFEVGVGDVTTAERANGFEVKKDGSARVLTESTEPDAVVRYSQLDNVVVTAGYTEPGTDRYTWYDLSNGGTKPAENITLANMNFDGDIEGEMPAGWVESPVTPYPEITTAKNYFYQKVKSVAGRGNVFAFANYHSKNYFVRYPLHKAVSNAVLTYQFYLIQPSQTANLGVQLPTLIYKGVDPLDGCERGATPVQLRVQQINGTPMLAVSYGRSSYKIMRGVLGYNKWHSIVLTADVTTKTLLVALDGLILELPAPTSDNALNWLPGGKFSEISVGTASDGLSNFYIDNLSLSATDEDPTYAVGLLTKKENGQKQYIYPVTKPEAVEGLKEYILAALPVYNGEVE